MKLAPEINGPLEYFYGFYFSFSNSDYALKNIFSSLGFFLGVFFASIVIPHKIHKKTLVIFYFLIILSLLSLLKLISTHGDQK